MNPCFSFDEIKKLVELCNTLRELQVINTVLIDDYELGRYSLEDYRSLARVLELKVNAVLGI